MKIDFTNPSTKKICLTILFYLIAAISIYVLEESSPSGPCTPGLGILSFMLLPFISAILLIINFIKTYKGDKTNKVSTLIHFIFIIGFFVYLKFV